MARMLSIEAFTQLDLAGARFEAFESRTHARGRIEAAAIEGDFLQLRVRDVEVLENGRWAEAEPIDYCGRLDMVRIDQHVAGLIEIDIACIARIEISPP